MQKFWIIKWFNLFIFKYIMIYLNTFNKLGAIGWLALTTGCSSGFKYNMDEPKVGKSKEIAKQAAFYDQSTAWATKIRVVQSGISSHIFEIGERKHELFLHDILLRAGVIPPLRAGDWPLRVEEWVNPDYPIPNWEYIGTLPDVELEDGDVVVKWSEDKDSTGNCGIVVGNRVVIAGDTKVYRVFHLLLGSVVRRYRGK